MNTSIIFPKTANAQRGVHDFHDQVVLANLYRIHSNSQNIIFFHLIFSYRLTQSPAERESSKNNFAGCSRVVFWTTDCHATSFK